MQGLLRRWDWHAWQLFVALLPPLGRPCSIPGNALPMVVLQMALSCAGCRALNLCEVHQKSDALVQL